MFQNLGALQCFSETSGFTMVTETSGFTMGFRNKGFCKGFKKLGAVQWVSEIMRFATDLLTLPSKRM